MSTMNDRIYPPWTPAQLRGLNEWQRSDHVHPFTCPYGCGSALEATEDGWVCRSHDCEGGAPAGFPVVQTWAHGFMAGPLPPDPSSPSNPE